jgi:hypothetical protein
MKYLALPLSHKRIRAFSMRIGVVTGDAPEIVGGSFTFVSSLVEGIKKVTSSHTFLFHKPTAAPQRQSWRSTIRRASASIGAGRLADLTSRQVRRWERRFGADEISPIERFIHESEIDVVWFLTPLGAPVSVPYIATVWDLQHRRLPIFPEVRTMGWDWDAREQTYRAALPQATRVVTGTHTGKNEIVQCYGVNPENIVTWQRIVTKPSTSGRNMASRVIFCSIRRSSGPIRIMSIY